MANTLPRRPCRNNRPRGCLVDRNHRWRIAHNILLHGHLSAHHLQADLAIASRHESIGGQLDFKAQDKAQVQELVGLGFR